MARDSVQARPLKEGAMRYRIKWEGVGPDGKCRRHSATRNTNQEADAFLAKQLDAVEPGTFVIASRETLVRFPDGWLDASAPGWSTSTLYQLRCILRARIAPRLGSKPLARLDALAIQASYAELLEDCAPGTVRETHAPPASARRSTARRCNASCRANPLEGVTPPAAHAQAPQVWSAAQAATFLEKTKDDDLAPLWRLGLDSGMRIGETLGLAWNDVDLDRGVVAAAAPSPATAWRRS